MEKEEKLKKELLTVTRHNLSSIDLSDIKEEELSEEEAKSRNSEIERFYNGIFKNEIKKMIKDQLDFIMQTATENDQLNFGRGTLNGFKLVMEWFQDETNFALGELEKERKKEEKEVEPGKPFGDI